MKRPRIAILASNVTRIPPIPPSKYLAPGWSGATEIVAYSVAEGLVKRGYEVTLFASGDSKTGANLVSIAEKSSFESGDLKIHKDFENVLISKAYKMAKEGKFDIIHSHYDIPTAFFAPLVDVPTVSTLHSPIGFWYDKRILSYYKDSQWYVSISNNQREDMPELKYASTVYNGVPVDKIPFSSNKEDYVMVTGRIVKEKGIDIAIRAAQKAGTKLLIFGPIEKNSSYWAKEIEPYIDSKRICYMGMVKRQEIFEYMSKARAILMPIRWREPFGLVVAEAMAAGTPTITFPIGSMPEIVENNKTGFLVKNEDEMAEKIGIVSNINPTVYRETAIKRFSVESMVSGYESVYQKILTN